MRDRVVIIGSGLMGSGIAACSVLSGNPTVLIDLQEETAGKGRDNALRCVEELAENGLASREAAEKAPGLLSTHKDAAAFADTAKLVIEAIVENLPAKQELFAALDAIFPEEVPILSNTSGLRITDIAARMKKPERAVTAHFWFPAHLVPLVEVVIGDRTDPHTAAWVRNTLLDWGKAAVLMKRDTPGQLANRILQAVIREAIHIVEIGLASPEDVDTAVKMGMGIRLPAWGPLEHIEAVGLDLALSVQRTVLPEISASVEPSPYLQSLVERGNLGYKSGQGFYDWKEKDMEDLSARRNAFIMEARKILRN